MRFLVDENVGSFVARWLQGQGHEVFSVYDQARGSEDAVLLQKAYDEGWVLVTGDKDFGEKVFRERVPHRGVVLLRLEDERSAHKIERLGMLLKQYGEQLPDQFVVVTERQVRFAKTGLSLGRDEEITG
jgi:predicted nuclease of predicted toxin-antitoxin system